MIDPIEAHATLPIPRGLTCPQVQASALFLAASCVDDDEEAGALETLENVNRLRGYVASLQELATKGTREQIVRHLAWFAASLQRDADIARHEASFSVGSYVEAKS